MRRATHISHPEPVAKRVGLWLRVSTEDQANGESLEHHEARGRAYAEAKGWSVAEVYRLQGVSGKAIIEHPEAVRMLRDIERERITGLIFSKLARLARNTKELLEFAERFKVHDADLISLQESIDTSTPAGRLFYTMIAAMAQWEREEIASRVAASVPIRAKMGKSLGGPAPFGFSWIDGRLVVNPEEAPVRRLVHELFAETGRLKTVANRLNAMGHRTRKGKPFAFSGIRHMIEDPTAKGRRRANYKKRIDSGNKWGLKPESEWVYSEVEPIVSAELWDRCYRLLSERTERQRRPAKRAVQLFGGLTWCDCGQKMYVPSNTPKYVCQKCRNKIPIEDLEAIFFEQLKGFLLSPADLRRHVEKADGAIAGIREQIRALEQDRGKVVREADLVYRLYLDGELTSRGFGERHRPLEERLGQLDEEIPRLQAESDYLTINLLSEDEVLLQAQSLHDRWPKLDAEGKRQIVEAIVERITIGADEVTIDLYYLPTKDGPDPDPEYPAGYSGPDDKEPDGGTGPRLLLPRRIKPEARASSEIMAKGLTILDRGATSNFSDGIAAGGGCATPDFSQEVHATQGLRTTLMHSSFLSLKMR